MSRLYPSSLCLGFPPRVFYGVTRGSEALHLPVESVYEIKENDPNIFTESEKLDREQGTLTLSVTPTQIYEESDNNNFKISLKYDLGMEEATLHIELLSGYEANKYSNDITYIVFGEPNENIQDDETKNKKIIEDKLFKKGSGNISYSIDANIEITKPYIILAYFKNENGKTFATQFQRITVNEPKYMYEPIPNTTTMQTILQLTVLSATKQAENDFNRYSSTYSYAVPHLNLKDLLISVSSGSLRQIFAMGYPLTLSNECNEIIEDWHYVSRKKFENAVFIQAYMETIDKLQRRSRY
jgi:hypothetical protein